MNRIALGLALGAFAAAPAFAQDLPQTTATFFDEEGAQTGSATLTETEAGVLIELEVEGLPPSQWVAFHIHEFGVCDPHEDHETAGGHFNLDSREHGYLAPTGPHAGDMPNQWVGEDGVLRAHVFNSFVSFGDEGHGIVGRTLMIHAEGDDYVSQPAGEAGDRLACALIGEE